MKLVIDNVGKQYRRDFWGLCDFSLDLAPGVLGLYFLSVSLALIRLANAGWRQGT